MAQAKKAKKVSADNVSADIKRYFEGLGDNNVIFTNELHLQMHLSQFLKEEGYGLLYEYHVPSDQLKGDYPWLKPNSIKRSEMYLDIVVYDGKEYLPIEIKYKTRSLETNTRVFGDPEKEVELLRDQGAQDLGMYGFWKDVYRIELVRDTYKNVKNGIAIFVTNDPYYQENNPTPEVNHFHFRMTGGRRVNNEELHWVDSESKSARTYKSFKIEGNYTIEWNPIGQYGIPRKRADFSYCMLII